MDRLAIRQVALGSSPYFKKQGKISYFEYNLLNPYMKGKDQFTMATTSSSGVKNYPKFGAVFVHPLNKLLSPKNIAVIGASPTEGTIGFTILENLINNGFKGAIIPVNPKYAGQTISLEGKNLAPFLGDVKDLPDGTIDMALIMTPAKTVPGIVKQLGEKSIKAVVVISAGFGEVGESGKVLEESLKQAIAEHKIRMIGPNCVGVANSAIGLNATFAKGHVAHGKGAIMSQSGAVSIDLINEANQTGLGFSQMASIGNQTDVDSSHLLAHWKRDPSVKYVLGYLESIQSPHAFRKIASAVTKAKPVIVIKSGSSEKGAQAASSHTGALAGNETAVDALFKQTGIQRVHSIRELFAVAKAFEYAPPLQGNRVAVISNSGGYGVMLTDLIEPQKDGLKMAVFSEETRKSLADFLPLQASCKNPADTIATTPSDSPEKFKQAILAVANDPGVDSIIVSIIPVLNMNMNDVGRILSDVQQSISKPVMAVLRLGANDLLKIQNTLITENRKMLSLYRNLEDAITGLTAMERHRQWVSRSSGNYISFPDVKTAKVADIIRQTRSEGRKLLTTTESLDVLEAYGIKTAPYALATEDETILQKASELGYPVAIKLVSKTVTHKTDVGGVIIDIRTPEQLKNELKQLKENLKAKGIKDFKPGEGIMVQKFIKQGRETLIGFKEDEKFGKMLAFALGGIYVNILKDVAFRLAPVKDQDVKEMIRSIQMIDILKGSRGKEGVDFETLEETILRYSQLLKDFPELLESDINPFFAQPKPSPQEKGGIAVDARFTLK